MNKIAELLDQLRQLEDTEAETKGKIQHVRNMIMTIMESDGLTQVKTPTETVSRAKRVNYQVNEFEWRKWASQQPDVELDLFYVTTIDKKKVTDHAEKTLKTTGEIVPGIEANETEYLSIRKVAGK